MLTIKEVIQIALSDYGRCDFMCHAVEELCIDQNDIDKTLEFIKSQLDGEFTLNGFLIEKSTEYEELCAPMALSYESVEPYNYRVKWWNEIIKLPEAQV